MSEKDKKITLKVDGEAISLNPFVQDIFINIIEGMILSLDKIPTDRNKIEVTLQKE